MANAQKQSGEVNSAGSDTSKTIKSKWRSNDGVEIPTGPAAASKKPMLTAKDKMSNVDMFEKYRKGGAAMNGAIEGMHSWRPGENLDDPGLDASGGCFYKWGTPYGEQAMFNQLPPGPDISDQAYVLIHNMPFRQYSGGVTFPGDTPWPVRDVEE